MVKDDDHTAHVLAELGADVPTWRAAQERAVSELGQAPADHMRIQIATLEVLLVTGLALCASLSLPSAPSSPAAN